MKGRAIQNSAIVVQEMYSQACSGYLFYFLSSLIKIILVETIFSRCCLELSLFVCLFLSCFLIFTKFQPHITYKKNVY